jgi:hypothetical protein
MQSSSKVFDSLSANTPKESKSLMRQTD